MAASFLERASRPLSCPTLIFSSPPPTRLLSLYLSLLSLFYLFSPSLNGLEKKEKETVLEVARENRANYSLSRLHNSTINLITARSRSASPRAQQRLRVNVIACIPPPRYRALPRAISLRDATLVTRVRRRKKLTEKGQTSRRSTIARRVIATTVDRPTLERFEIARRKGGLGGLVRFLVRETRKPTHTHTHTQDARILSSF